MRYLAVCGKRARVIDAADPEAAALQAARTMTSVYGLRKGEIISLYPAQFAKDVKVQYERPDAEPVEGMLDQLGGDYGKPVVVDEFKGASLRGSIFR